MDIFRLFDKLQKEAFDLSGAFRHKTAFFSASRLVGSFGWVESRPYLVLDKSWVRNLNHGK
ncbi:unnamed protein product [Oikopleura dioica]|uniref:Uncharacterized protein n=1 Tax=Oikopleura dioica TaxID=34765 RepID=E4XJG8_OIKDI|nr:unnamed protein product [Oikopleura dioica]